MRLNDPTINSLVPSAVCYDFGISEMIAVSIISTVASVGFGVAGAVAQASAQEAQAAAQMQQAENARAIAQYNADIQRQNTEVAYQLALYQAQTSAQMAQINQASAIANASYAELQAAGAQGAYEQQLENAKQQEMQAAATRAAASEEVNRTREENEQRISMIRSKYGASGVAFEGSPLAVLADTAQLGEVTAQDAYYAGELQSEKELREAEIERFNASFSLIDQYGFNVEAQNLRNQAAQYGYESQLYEYDSAIAGAQKRIGLNQAKLVELGGEEKGFAYEAAAQQSQMAASASLLTGIGGGITSGLKGISSGMTNYGYATGKLPFTPYTPEK